jgi:hypothetical protein
MHVQLPRLSRTLGGALATLAAAAVQAHPGHGAPDIIHGLDAMAAAPVTAGPGALQVLALGLAVAGAVALLLGPVAAAAGRRLAPSLLRLSRPLGVAALLAAAALCLV